MPPAQAGTSELAGRCFPRACLHVTAGRGGQTAGALCRGIALSPAGGQLLCAAGLTTIAREGWAWPLVVLESKAWCCLLQARESYEKALQLEPDNQDYLAALQRADQMERKQADQHQHKFRRRDDRLLDKLPPRNIKGKPASGSHAKSRRPMSFEDDEGD